MLVVGPFGARSGGIVTFQRNLLERSSVGTRWELRRFDISRPDKRKTVTNDRYLSLLSEGPGYVLRAIGVTAWHLLSFPFVLLRRRPAVVQIQGGDRWGFFEAVLYALLARACRVPTVMRFGGSFDAFWSDSSPRVRPWIRRGLRVAHRLVVQSEFWRKLYSDVSGRDDIAILPNSVPQPTRTPVFRDDVRRVRALFISLAEAERKGLSTVLTALPHLGDAIELTVVGANDAVRERLRQAAPMRRSSSVTRCRATRCSRPTVTRICCYSRRLRKGFRTRCSKRWPPGSLSSPRRSARSRKSSTTASTAC